MMMKPKTNDANEIRLYKARGGLPMRPLNRDEALRVIAIDCGWTLQYTATSLKDGETAELIRIATKSLRHLIMMKVIDALKDPSQPRGGKVDLHKIRNFDADHPGQIRAWALALLLGPN